MHLSVKQAPYRLRRFESCPAHQCQDSSAGKSTSLVMKRSWVRFPLLAFMKKKHLFIFPIIFLIVLGVFLYIKEISSPNDFSEENQQEKDFQEFQLSRQGIMEDIVGKISEISPVEPVLGGSWYVIRFWFIEESNENFYVEYEDGHILRQILVSAEKKDNKIKYKVIGYFEPGETMWMLKRGENPFLGKTLELYEHDEETGQWIKRN